MDCLSGRVYIRVYKKRGHPCWRFRCWDDWTITRTRSDNKKTELKGLCVGVQGRNDGGDRLSCELGGESAPVCNVLTGTPPPPPPPPSPSYKLVLRESQGHTHQ